MKGSELVCTPTWPEKLIICTIEIGEAGRHRRQDRGHLERFVMRWTDVSMFACLCVALCRPSEDTIAHLRCYSATYEALEELRRALYGRQSLCVGKLCENSVRLAHTHGCLCILTKQAVQVQEVLKQISLPRVPACFQGWRC